MTSKRCRRCQQDKPETRFRKAGKWRRGTCRDCERVPLGPVVSVAARVETVPMTADGRPILRRSLVEGMLACTEYRSQSSAEAAYGTCLHDAFARYVAVCRSRGTETALDAVSDIIEAAYLGTARGQDPNRLGEAVDLLQRFAQSHPAELDSLIGVELTMTADLGWAVVTGTVDRADRIDDGDPDDEPTVVRITDYKTGWSVEAHTFQMLFYGALACHRWPTVESVAMRVDHVQLGARGVIDVECPRGDLLRWMDAVSAAARQRWEARGGVPTGGAACRWCALRRTCPEGIEPARSVPTSDGEAVKLADQWIRLDASRGIVHDALQEWFKRRPPLELNGLEIGWLTPREPQWRASDVVGIVRELDARGLKGSEVIFTAVDRDKVPAHLHAELVQAGVARFDYGKPGFRARKVETRVRRAAS